MKLALVLAEDPTRFRGGTEVVAAAQGRALAALGHEVRLVVPAGEGDVARERLAERLELARVPRRTTPPTVLVDARARDAVAVACSGADVAHVHGWSASSLDLVRALAGSVPVVLHLHDAFAVCARSFRVPRGGTRCPDRSDPRACAACLARDILGLGEDALAARLVERRAHLARELDAARAVLAPSAFLARLVADGLGVPEPRVVAHGLCVEPPRRWPSVVPDASAPLRLLHAGNRAEAKGCLDLARAVAALPLGSVTVRFVGREVEPGIDACIARLAGERVRFEGAYAAADWPRLAAEHDLCALPSRAAESYGLVAEEALAHGLPTWVAASGALPERVADAAAAHPCAGRVLPAGDAEAWRAALAELVASPKRLQDARRLLPRVARGVRDCARELEALDHELLAERTPTHPRA